MSSSPSWRSGWSSSGIRRVSRSLTARFGEANVQSIADTLATTQQNVSGHLRLLRAMGVVSYRREGRESFCAVADETVFDVWERALTGLREPEH